MDLDFSEEQIMLRDTVARLCGDHCDSAAIRRLESDETGYSLPFWRAVAETGLCGLLIDEARGGIGLGLLESAIVHEEMGRTLAPSPHFVSCIVAALLLQSAGSPEQQAHWLPAIAAGERILVPAWQEAGVGADPGALRTRVQRCGDELLLEGEKVLVPYANTADALLVLCRDEYGALRVIVVPAHAAMLRRQPNHADQNLYAACFERLRLPASAMLCQDALDRHWDETLLQGQIPLAAQAIGGATRMLGMAVDYARQREQFGQPIGAFKAIAHYLADRATEIEGARYLVYQAAWACDRGEDWKQLAMMAKLQATAVFRRTTVSGVQIHGGMGFSAEADPQLYYRRAKHLQLTYGDPRYLEQRIASEVFG
jgi:alkylation response protein AidB-like acyl-CoA dehydrogenase